jgi:hypothetical protein
MNDTPASSSVSSPATQLPPHAAMPATGTQRLKRMLGNTLRGLAWFLATAAILALAFLILAAFVPEWGVGRVVLGGEFDVPLSQVTQHGILTTLSVWAVLTLVLVISGIAVLFALVVSVIAFVLSLLVTALALIVPGLILLAPVALIAWVAYVAGRRSARAGLTAA